MGMRLTEVVCFHHGYPCKLTIHHQLGAIQFDRDMRAVLGYLFSQTAFGGAREKFQRLQQISTLLNLDIVRDYAISFHLSKFDSRKRTWMNFTITLGSIGD